MPRRELDCTGDILTPAEAGKLLGKSPKGIMRMEDQGQLKCFRTIGGHRRFRVADNPKLQKAQQLLRNA